MHHPMLGEPYRVTAFQRTTVLAYLLALSEDNRYGRYAMSLSDAGTAVYVGRIDFELRIPTIVTAHTDERDRCSVRASVVFRV